MMKTHVIHPPNTTISCFVAMGGYGKVFKGKYTQPATDETPEEEIDVAIKVIDRYDEETNCRCKRVGREIDVLQKLKGNNEFIEPLHIYRAPAEKDDKSLYIIMPFVPYTAFQVARNTELRQSPDYVEVVVKLIVAQVLSGLEKMHKNTLFHRDMSSSNILVDLDNNFAFISDFGLSRAATGGNEMLTPLVVTLPYRALELLLDPHAKDGYSPANLDLWGLGMILWELLCGKQLQGLDETKQAILVVTTLFSDTFDFDFWEKYNGGEGAKKATSFLKTNKAKWAGPPKIPKEITSTSRECQDVLFKLLSQKPQDRGTASEILNMPWFAEDSFVKEALNFLRSTQPPEGVDYKSDVDPTPAFFDKVAPRIPIDGCKATIVNHTTTESAPVTMI